MKKKRCVTEAFLVVGVLFLTASFGWARWPGDGEGPGPRGDGKGRMEEHMKRVEKQLNLSPEQQKKLEEHRAAHRDEAKKFFGEVKQKREEMRTELEKETIDEAKVKAINEELKALGARLADHRLAGILEVRRILTPEQFKKFQELAGPRGKDKGRGGRRGRGPGRDDADMPPPPDEP